MTEATESNLTIETEAPRPRRTRANARGNAREMSRDPSRGNLQVRGRDGEVLSRKRTAGADPFAIPPEVVPDGWEYQWIAMSVVGNKEVVMDDHLRMIENGWRPVRIEDAPQLQGRYMPAGASGHIIRGGQGLYERPKELCDEARAEDIRNAKQQITDRNDSLKLSGLKQQMPQGFEMGGHYKNTGGNIRLSIDPSLDADVPRPQHQLMDND